MRYLREGLILLRSLNERETIHIVLRAELNGRALASNGLRGPGDPDCGLEAWDDVGDKVIL